LLLNNKAEFILEYNEYKNQSLKRDDVDWSQSKVIFISPQFTKCQKQAINFRDLPIELSDISKFANGTILFNELKSPEMSESITVINQSSEIVQKVSKEIKVDTEEDHLNGLLNGTVELYQAFKERILALGKAGWQKYDEATIKGITMHFYRKPKRFGGVKKLDDKL